MPGGEGAGAHVVSDEVLVVAVRVHADRVHDAARRLGAPADAALEVVEQSAQDLVDEAAHGDTPVAELVGWWFARARALARRVAPPEREAPVGSGLLAASDEQALLVQELDRLPEDERVLLLLRDVYDLPMQTVAAAVGTDEDEAAEAVGRARVLLLPRVFDDAPPADPDHRTDRPALARLAHGGPVAARDATARRHVQACSACRSLVEAQEDVRRLLAGVAVAALPEDERAGLLERVGARAEELLTPIGGLAFDVEDDDEPLPPRLFAPLPVLLALLLAVGSGVGLGALASRDDPARVTTVGSLTQVTAPPVRTAPARPPVAPTTPPPPLAAVTLTPTPTPTAVAPSTPPPVPTTLEVTPGSGPDGATLTLVGRGWLPGFPVTVRYLDPLGRDTGSGTALTPGPTGTFTVSFTARDPLGLPGPHEVVATSAGREASATYEVT